MLTGECIDARTSFNWGVVNEVVSSDALLNRCVAIGMAIAAAGREYARLQLEALRETDAIGFGVALENERMALARFEISRLTADSDPGRD
jgi:enoyl-CoA hydratase/carnithine racemase